MQYKFGDGASNFMWMENWHPIGHSTKDLVKQLSTHLGSSLQAEVDKLSSRSLEVA
ncbi:hypothetical protein RHMOL_Rhmol10G0109700 [Rhododendron molle]|uniref:Uncharacterized protein n=1 Tax=Rhododendron molle TaxID=49168 RepID=A0ACC0M156_RHOML|nr:hypothetical protein RHMOL_Rhmol10G0109700 [Rhododendron molle]